MTTTRVGMRDSKFFLLRGGLLEIPVIILDNLVFQIISLIYNFWLLLFGRITIWTAREARLAKIRILFGRNVISNDARNARWNYFNCPNCWRIFQKLNLDVEIMIQIVSNFQKHNLDVEIMMRWLSNLSKIQFGRRNKIEIVSRNVQNTIWTRKYGWNSYKIS